MYLLRIGALEQWAFAAKKTRNTPVGEQALGCKTHAECRKNCKGRLVNSRVRLEVADANYQATQCEMF
jgi:hypothetical protein